MCRWNYDLLSYNNITDDDDDDDDDDYLGLHLFKISEN